jgi:hypothetical protein
MSPADDQPSPASDAPKLAADRPYMPLLAPPDIYWDGAHAKAADSFASPEPWMMSYSASPMGSDDFCAPPLYDASGALPFVHDDAFIGGLSLPSAHLIFAPQPVRRPSVMSIESSSDSASSTSELGFDMLSLGNVPLFSHVSPAASVYSSPGPECFDAYDTQSIYLKYAVRPYLLVERSC